MDQQLTNSTPWLRLAKARGPAAHRPQRGVALYVVMLLVLLTVVLALWASRTALMTEIVTGNDADYQRAFEAAQAMVQDAKDDIYGNLYAKGKALTRGATLGMQYPTAQSNFQEWSAVLRGEATGCLQAICLRRTGGDNFWDDEASLVAMLPKGARYGQFSGAQASTHINPVLMLRAANKGAWYWVEPIPFKGAEVGDVARLVQGLGNLTVETDMLFRITAIALGLKGSSQDDKDLAKRSPTMAVIQTVVALPVNKGE